MYKINTHTHRARYEYEKCYLCIDRSQRLFPRPLASLLRCGATVRHRSGALRHPVLSQPPLSPTHGKNTSKNFTAYGRASLRSGCSLTFALLSKPAYLSLVQGEALNIYTGREHARITIKVLLRGFLLPIKYDIIVVISF